MRFWTESRAFICLPPQDYLPFVMLMKRARIILTDSGCIQEEAPSLKRRCSLRARRRAATEAISARNRDPLSAQTDDRAPSSKRRRACSQTIFTTRRRPSAANPYGDGHAARRNHGRPAVFLQALLAAAEGIRVLRKNI